MRFNGLRATLAAAAFGILAGCAGQLVSPGLPTVSSAGQVGTSGVTHPATVKSTILYIADNSAGVVYYSLPLPKNPSPAGTITQGISFASGVVLDTSGNLYVADSGSGTVQFYLAGQSSPSRSYSDQISSPHGLALSKAGALYVCNFYGSSLNNPILVFPPGKTKPSRSISYPYSAPNSLAFDTHQNLFIADGEYGAILELTKGSSTPVQLSLTGPSGQAVGLPSSVAIDSHDNLYVNWLSHQGGTIVTVYAPGATMPTRSFQQNMGLSYSYSLALTKEDHLFVGTIDNGGSTGGFVDEYKPGQSTPFRTITNGIGAPSAMAAERF